ncbi:MAG: hypothetical protein ACTS73_07470 [Arsenophonus sp. NEOnobi-MAG3]
MLLGEEGTLGFWNAILKVFLDIQHQRYWVHKTANVLALLSKGIKPKVKAELGGGRLCLAESCDVANKALDLVFV